MSNATLTLPDEGPVPLVKANGKRHIPANKNLRLSYVHCAITGLNKTGYCIKY